MDIAINSFNGLEFGVRFIFPSELPEYEMENDYTWGMVISVLCFSVFIGKCKS